MAERVMTDSNGRKYITTEPFKPDWDEKAVLVQEMQRMAKRIEELEGSIAFLSSAYEIMSKHNDELMEIQREEIKSKIAQAKERNFCSRCGKRLMSALGPVSLHTCCPPTTPTGWDNGLSQDYNKKLGAWFSEKPNAKEELRARTFDDYGNKIS